MDVHAADGLDAGQHVLLAFRVGLVQHTLVAHADGARLVRVHAGDEQDRVLHLFLHLRQACHIVQHGRFVVGRAGPDEEQEAVVLPRQDPFDFLVPSVFQRHQVRPQRDFLLQIQRFRQLADELHLTFHV